MISLLFILCFMLFEGCKIEGQSSNTDRYSYPQKGGKYHDMIFTSQARGVVDINVYLPPGWSEKGWETYPLLFFLHASSPTLFTVLGIHP